MSLLTKPMLYWTVIDYVIFYITLFAVIGFCWIIIETVTNIRKGGEDGQ